MRILFQPSIFSVPGWATMPAKYDEATKAKAVRLVTGHRADR
ncbi:hypothetical protein OH799_16430 [Nocardia sp. NBC_00881]|nr:hypothetical protein OH799_16430 [Nocardia sp. NBC_00881]